MSQLTNSNGVVGDEETVNSTAIEGKVASETKVLVGVAGNAAATTGGVVSGIPGAIIGSARLLDKINAAVPTTSAEAQEPPAATVSEPTRQPEPTTPVETEVETAGPEIATTAKPEPDLAAEPSSDPSPIIETSPPTVVPAPISTSLVASADQDQKEPVPAPVRVQETPTAPAPTSTPTVSAEEEPVESSANLVATGGSSSATASRPTTSPEAQIETAAGAAPLEELATSQAPTSETSSPIATKSPESSSPSLTLINPSATTLTPIPTSTSTNKDSIAALDADSNLSSSPNPDSDSIDPNSNTDPFSDPSIANNPDTPDTNNNSISSDSLPLSTKIGVGVGVGVGTLLLGALLTFCIWKRRMGRGPPKLSNYDNYNTYSSSISSSVSGDVEGAATPPQEKAKLDFESEHDVAVDFGAFFREKRRGPLAVTNATEGKGR
ncbi:hypothetical protein N0V88_007546 [Collariella sp. IMI 366227]|nr:hypothetical protein N0V88_007546 [Collariella sp. IMI 366227]